jgi:hypothetical protein
MLIILIVCNPDIELYYTHINKDQSSQPACQPASSGVLTGGGLVGVQTPPMTEPTKIFSIEFNMVYSVLCVIYAVSLAQ